jgi:hypothetical protein
LQDDTKAGRCQRQLRDVTDSQWERFVEDSVKPQFSEAFTVMHGRGLWRNREGTLHREETRVIEIALIIDAASAGWEATLNCRSNDHRAGS